MSRSFVSTEPGISALGTSSMRVADWMALEFSWLFCCNCILTFFVDNLERPIPSASFLFFALHDPKWFVLGSTVICHMSSVNLPKRYQIKQPSQLKRWKWFRYVQVDSRSRLEKPDEWPGKLSQQCYWSLDIFPLFTNIPFFHYPLRLSSKAANCNCLEHSSKSFCSLRGPGRGPALPTPIWSSPVEARRCLKSWQEEAKAKAPVQARIQQNVLNKGPKSRKRTWSTWV